MLAYALGMDLGTSSVLLYRAGKGILLEEPSVIAVRRGSGTVVRTGTEAQALLGRAPDDLVAVHPMKGGVISDCGMTGIMIQDFIRKSGRRRFSRFDLLVCVPPIISELEERAVIDAGLQAGANKVFLMEEPVAAAAGAGVDPMSARGILLIDIGAGTTDVAVLSCGAVAAAQSIRTAGNRMDRAIQLYLRETHGLDIGECTAEYLKNTIGCVLPREEPAECTVRGRNSKNGLPDGISVTDAELAQPILSCMEQIVQTVCAVIARTPPELVGDLAENGILLTGGVAQLYGLPQYLQQRLGLHTRVAEEPLTCVARGTERWLERLDQMDEGPINLARRRMGIA